MRILNTELSSEMPLQDGMMLFCSIGRLGATFPVEVVSTQAGMRKGLSGRPKLERGHGMLFCFRDQNVHSMWMPDMQFSLDIIWIDDTFTIVNVNKKAVPCVSRIPSECPSYSSEYPALFAIEVNAGDADALGLRVGEKVSFSEE
jgi:uncharacterized membrane protein (UPF0127 family)